MPTRRHARRHAGRWPMSSRPVSRAERHPAVASSPVPEHPRHPQGRDPAATTEGNCPVAVEPGSAESAPDAQRPRCATCCCARRRSPVPVPEPDALRPLARALLAVAAEVQAPRRDLPGTRRRPADGALRMGNRGLVQGLHSGVRSVVRSPATPERTGCGDTSSHVEAAPTPPVKNSDCIGDCA